MRRVFIIGNPRSGTTLLRLMLNKHTKMSVPPEAGFLAWLYKTFSNFTFSEKNAEAFIEALKKTSKIENWNLDFHALEEYIKKQKPADYSRLIDAVYAYYSKYILKKDVELYGDKNNFYLNEIELLHRLYPDAKFLHIIRDGRSVAVSYKELNAKAIDAKYAPDLPVDIEKIAQEWTQNIGTIETSFETLGPDQHFTVRFEDLISKPEEVLRDLCHFLDIDYDEEMLNYYKTTESEGLEPSSFLEWKSKNKMPLQHEEVFKYKKLSQTELGLFEHLAESTLAQYGYV
jgi:hypothetical protein